MSFRIDDFGIEFRCCNCQRHSITWGCNFDPLYSFLDRQFAMRHVMPVAGAQKLDKLAASSSADECPRYNSSTKIMLTNFNAQLKRLNNRVKIVYKSCLKGGGITMLDTFNRRCRQGFVCNLSQQFLLLQPYKLRQQCHISP